MQEGRNVQYTGIVHAARTILKEVRPTGALEGQHQAAICYSSDSVAIAAGVIAGTRITAWLQHSCN